MSTIEQLRVCDSLTVEHRQMENLLEVLEIALKTNDLPLFRNTSQKIASEMDMHFACEEQALFPAVSPYHPMDLMEAEHEELVVLRNTLLEILRFDTLSEREWLDLKEIGTRFIQEMLDHIGREDAGIFPACEQALSHEQKLSVVTKMNLIRAATY